MPGKKKPAFKILVADDSEDDRYFLKRLLEFFPSFQLIGEVCDGQEAIDYLSGQRDYADRQRYPLPDLLLLDLKMPRQNGSDVLKWLQTTKLSDLTVAVLSSSSLESDKDSSIALGAHGFWTKAAELEKQKMTIREIEALLKSRHP